MQLEQCSLLAKGQPAPAKHIYYEPASEMCPKELAKLLKNPRLPPLPPLQQKRTQESEAFPRPSSPVLNTVLEKRRQEVKDALLAQRTTRRRHTWHGIDFEEEAMKQAEADQRFGTVRADSEEELPVSHRVAALLLPGLKRLRNDAPHSERHRLTQEIEQLQKLLGVKDVPTPRQFVVARRCDREQEGEAADQPVFSRSASY